MTSEFWFGVFFVVVIVGQIMAGFGYGPHGG